MKQFYVLQVLAAHNHDKKAKCFAPSQLIDSFLIILAVCVRCFLAWIRLLRALDFSIEMRSTRSVRTELDLLRT